ncbi:hypothetical protein SK128_026181, partial [Halocaridina rubra]
MSGQGYHLVVLSVEVHHYCHHVWKRSPNSPGIMVVLCGHLEVVVVEAINLPNLDQNVLRPQDKSDPYCVVEVQAG